MENRLIDICQIENNEKYGLVVSSRVVAKELGKQHKNVIRSLEEILTSSDLSRLIIESNYTDRKGETRKEYLLTKDGFTLYMFNIQGYQDFKMAYIQKFNEMEKLLYQKTLYPANNLLEDIKDLTYKVNKLEEEYGSITLSWTKYETLKDGIESTIKRRIKLSKIENKNFEKEILNELQNELYEKFGISTLDKIKVKDWYLAMGYIYNWIEKYSTREKYVQKGLK